MKKLLILFFGAGVLLGCEQEGLNPAGEYLAFYPQTKLANEYPFAVPGDKVVFHRHFEREDEENIADDEYAEDFFLEVETPGEGFDFDTEDLIEMKDLLIYYCYCVYTEHSALKEGHITGTRISATTYELDVDVTYEYYVLSEDKQDTLNTFTKQVKYNGMHRQDAVQAN